MRSIALSLSLGVLASCSDFSLEDGGWRLAYSPAEGGVEGDSGSALFVELYEGISADEDSIPRLRRLANGWRRYPAMGGFLALDLDEEVDWEKVGEMEGGPEWYSGEYGEEMYGRLRESITIKEVGFFVGEDGRLGFYRATLIEDLPFFLRFANELCSLSMADSWKKEIKDWGPFQPGRWTKARWMSRIAKKEPWVTRVGDSFVLDIPMTEGEAAGFLRAVLEDADDFLGANPFIPTLGGVRIAEGSLSLTFSPEENTFSFQHEHQDLTPSEGLVEALELDPGLKNFDHFELFR